MLIHHLLFLFSSVTLSHFHSEPYSTEKLIAALKIGHDIGNHVQGVPHDFECGWRKAAYNYSSKLQPFLSKSSMKQIWDALELTTLCSSRFVVPTSTSKKSSPIERSTPNSDRHVNTTQGMLDALADAAKYPEQEMKIMLAPGTYRLSKTLVLNPSHSNTIIKSESIDSSVTITGNILVNDLKWTPAGSGFAKGVFTTTIPKQFCADLMAVDAENLIRSGSDYKTIYLPLNSPISECVNACCGDGPNCVAVSWNNGSQYCGKNSVCCKLKNKIPKATQNVYGPNVRTAYRRSIDALRINGARVTRARYPNANPELDHFPKGYVLDKTQWSRPKSFGPTTNLTRELPGTYPGNFAGEYRMGIGGVCSRLTPPQSYWCQPNGRVADKTYFVRTPSGIQNITKHLPHSPYKSGGEDMILTYWRPGHWFSIMYGMDGSISPKGDVQFGVGGFQGAEGHDTGAEWFIENVLEELDAKNEFFYNAAAMQLYLFYNGTGTPPETIEIPSLVELIHVEGSQVYPVKNITISGISFTGQRPTYLEPHGTPSGGDWGLPRLGAIRLTGTEGVTVQECFFHRLDGTAIFLDGYNRHACINRNEFVWIGASAIALWGYEDDGWGTSGDQPRYTEVTENICHEIGIYQKQSSCFFQAVSAQSTIKLNIFFNGPRAMVNFNDGFGGGHDLSNNLLFNTCRESSDHGAFNSWDRQPYVTYVGSNGTTPTAETAYSKLHHNFIVANYAADGGCFDNDDGSSWYLEQNNFCVYGGMKSNFQGHNKRSSNNVHAFASVYGDHCLSGINQISDHYAEGYYNNTCILSKSGDPYISLSGCNENHPESFHTLLGNNKIYAPDSNAVVHCSKTMSFTEWQTHGLDKGSKIGDSNKLKTDQIIQWGLSVLGFKPSDSGV